MLFRQQPEEHLPHRVSRGILGRLGAPRLQLALQLARCHWQGREANVWGLQACRSVAARFELQVGGSWVRMAVTHCFEG